MIVIALSVEIGRARALLWGGAIGAGRIKLPMGGFVATMRKLNEVGILHVKYNQQYESIPRRYNRVLAHTYHSCT